MTEIKDGSICAGVSEILDGAPSNLRLKGLTMEGAVQMNANALNFGTGNQIVYKAASDLYLQRYGEVYINKILLVETAPSLNLGSGVLIGMKRFTSSPALADMALGEVALGDGTGTGAIDEIFFKPDAAKIVALASDGSARTITS